MSKFQATGYVDKLQDPDDEDANDTDDDDVGASG